MAMVGGLFALGFVTFPALVAQLRQLADGAPAMQQKLAERLSART